MEMAEFPPHLRDVPLFKRAELALREAARKVILEHRRTGDLLVYWRDGKVVLVSPFEVPVPEMDPLTAQFEEAAGRVRTRTYRTYTMVQAPEPVVSPFLMWPTGRTL
jgi:hypothetical protein